MAVPMPPTGGVSATSLYAEDGHVVNDSVQLAWMAPTPSADAPRTGWRVRWADTLEVVTELADATTSGSMSLTCHLGNRSLEGRSVAFTLVAYGPAGESVPVTSGEVFGRLPSTAPPVVTRVWDVCDEFVVTWTDPSVAMTYQHLIELTLASGTMSFTTDVAVGSARTGRVVIPLSETPDPDGFLLSAVTVTARLVPASASIDRESHAGVAGSTVVAGGTHGVSSGTMAAVTSSGQRLCDVSFAGVQVADSYLVTFVGGDKALVGFGATGAETYDWTVVPALRFRWQAAGRLRAVVMAVRNGFSSEPYEIPTSYEFVPLALTAPVPTRVWRPDPTGAPSSFSVSFGDASCGTPLTTSGADAYRYVVTVDGSAAESQVPPSTEAVAVGATHVFAFSLRDPSTASVGIRVIDAAGVASDSVMTVPASFPATGCALYAYRAGLSMRDCDVSGSGTMVMAYQSTISTDGCRFAGVGTGSAYYIMDEDSLCFEGSDEFE